MLTSALPRAGRRGFTLLELGIVLGVSGLLFGGLFQLLSNSNSQISAQSAAQMQQTMIRAARTYVINNFNTLTGAATGTVTPVLVANLTPTTLLPTQNSYGQPYNVYVRNEGSSVVSFMIVDSGGTALVDSVGGVVASLIGAEGGFIYQNPSTGSCDANHPGYVTTSFGGGCVNPLNYSAAAAALATGGHIASVSFVTSNDIGNDLSQFLSRLVIPGVPIMNTMQAEEQFAIAGGASPEGAAVATPGIAMGANNIYMYNSGATATGGNFFAQGGNIALGNSAATGGTGGGTLYMNSGSVDMTSGGAILMGNGCTLRASPGGGTLPNPSPPPASLSDGATGTLTIGTAGITPCDFEADSIFAENIQASNSLFAGSYIYNSSDGRLKKDIEPLPDNMLDRLLALQPVSFRWKRNNQKETGFIAQDLQKQFPELVATAPNGFLALQIDGLIAPIVEALKELRAQNESLRERLDATAKSSRSSVAFQKSHETDFDPDSTGSPDAVIAPILQALNKLKAENEELRRQAAQNQKQIDELKKHPCADSL